MEQVRARSCRSWLSAGTAAALLVGSVTAPGWPMGTKTEKILFVMDADGSHNTQLTHSADEMELGSQWAADGKRIFFSRFQKSGGPGKAQVYVMDADGSNVQPLTKSDAAGVLGTGPGLMVLMSRVVHGD